MLARGSARAGCARDTKLKSTVQLGGDGAAKVRWRTKSRTDGSRLQLQCVSAVVDACALPTVQQPQLSIRYSRRCCAAWAHSGRFVSGSTASERALASKGGRGNVDVSLSLFQAQANGIHTSRIIASSHH